MSDFTTLLETPQPEGFVVRRIRYDDLEFDQAFMPNGDYIGDVDTARRLCGERGIVPERAEPDDQMCSIGFCAREQKWYGWSHRAIFGFGIGDVAKEGDCATTSGWVEDYLRQHPEADRRVPVGFTAHTLDDAKRMAIAYAESVG